jgi:Na+/H+ ion antiporter subunit
VFAPAVKGISAEVNSSTRRGLSLVAFFLLWLVLVGTGSGGELVAGLIGATSATLASEILVRAGLLPFGGHRRSWTPAVRALVRVPVDTALVVAALVRGRRGRFRVSELPYGRDWRRHAERGVGALAASLAPNSVVIDIDPGRRISLRHELARQDEDPLK